MSKLVKVSVLAMSLAILLGTSAQAAPVAAQAVTTTSNTLAAVKNLTLGVGNTYRIKTKFAYHTIADKSVVSMTMGTLTGKKVGTTMVRLYDKNDNEIAAYRVTVKNIL